MDELIKAKLGQVAESLSIYSATPPPSIEEVFTFDVNLLENTNPQAISKYTIMLAQYLITLQVKYNTARVIASQKKKVLDRKVKVLIQIGDIKGSTLEERKANTIAANPELEELELEYDEAAAERDLLEGLDKPITELINAFKAELRRQAEERHYTNRE